MIGKKSRAAGGLIDVLSLLQARKQLDIPRCMTRDVILASGSEISIHFARLSHPAHCFDALVRLTNIARAQNFVVSSKKFDVILGVMQNANVIAAGHVQRGMRTTVSFDDVSQDAHPPAAGGTADQITSQSLELLDRIASFQSCFFVDQIERRHIMALRSYLPRDIVFKILGKLVARKREFAEWLVSAGFDDIAISDSMIPLFLWFIGSFAYYRELNELIVPIYDEFVFPAIATGDSVLVKYGVDALMILSANSSEAMEWVTKHGMFEAVFSMEVSDESAMRYLVMLALHFLRSGQFGVVSMLAFPGFIRRAFGCGSDEVKRMTFDVVAEIVRVSNSAMVIRERFDEYAIAVSSSDVCYAVKRSAMIVACLQLCVSSAGQKARYVQMGITDTIRNALDGTDYDGPIHSAGLQALLQITDLAKAEANYALLDLAKEIATDAEVEDEVLAYIMESEI